MALLKIIILFDEVVFGEFIDEIKNNVINNKSINEEEKKVMLDENIIREYYIDITLKKLLHLGTQIVNQLGLIDEFVSPSNIINWDDIEDKIEYDEEDNIIINKDINISYYLEKDEIDFLNKDKKTKKKMVNKIIDILLDNTIKD